MQLQLGDVLADEIDEWRVVGSPFTIAGGEMVNVRVESVKQAGLTQMRAWGPHERVAVRRG
jgi:type IV secretory pathway TrbF-like protein